MRYLVGAGFFFSLALPVFADGFGAAALAALVLAPVVWAAVLFLPAWLVAGYPAGGFAGALAGGLGAALMTAATQDQYSGGMLVSTLFNSEAHVLSVGLALLVGGACRVARFMSRNKAELEKVTADLES